MLSVDPSIEGQDFFALHDTLQPNDLDEKTENLNENSMLFDAKYEETLKSKLLATAFKVPSSSKKKGWVDVSTYDKEHNPITSHYRFITTTSYKMRASMLFKHTHDDIMNYFNYLESGYNDDDMTWTNKANLNIILKVIDRDHQMMYNQGNGGWMNYIISPRDTCYIRTRFKYTDFEHKQIKYEIAGSLHYSADTEHPYYYPVQQQCVRVDMKYRGFVLIRNKELKQTKLVYVAYFDIKGSIPQWLTENGIKNIAANYVQMFNGSWLDKIANLKERRKLKEKQRMKWWLTEVVALPQYVDVFLNNGFEDLSYLKDTNLSEHDLKEIGIHLKGHRLKILSEIQRLS
eukprot:CAMPEP_0197075736 /NCGR_PEP_ID=MMETSP1384-20130603/211760_1 /TAXON_ID=29189 /ORGANISM="Ammonia sp." /LENGTH=344 /DNA_ID=CAMNT_0042514585 /DNA_START=33 /DNA_END=1067 /DNA_ORIENTATION=+